MTEVLPSIIAAMASVAVALISAGVLGRRRKRKANRETVDPLLKEILRRWHDCEKLLTEARRPLDGRTPQSSSEQS